MWDLAGRQSRSAASSSSGVESPTWLRGACFSAALLAELAENLSRFCTDPSGFDRTAFHRDFDLSVVRFFREHLVGVGETG
jgi:hypothetical protein